ncbi:unnamed protein product [Amoebophrya sp. A25]|nr:unnamed protein product [Amoebophrya sp. A25]|eukprot:GSA25T00014467001.1
MINLSKVDHAVAAVDHESRKRGKLVKLGPNPRVFLDVQIGRRTGGRIVFELFQDATPETAENFRLLCTGEKGRSPFCRKDLTYSHSKITRIEQSVAFQAGDFVDNTGRGFGECAFFTRDGFKAEPATRRHAHAGVLSMCCDENRMCHSKFNVSFKKCGALDGKNIVFGQVVDGMDVVRAIERVPISGECEPRVDVVITGSGQLDEDEVEELVAKRKAEIVVGGRGNNSNRGGIVSKELGNTAAILGEELLLNPKNERAGVSPLKDGLGPKKEEESDDEEAEADVQIALGEAGLLGGAGGPSSSSSASSKPGYGDGDGSGTILGIKITGTTAGHGGGLQQGGSSSSSSSSAATKNLLLGKNKSSSGTTTLSATSNQSLLGTKSSSQILAESIASGLGVGGDEDGIGAISASSSIATDKRQRLLDLRLRMNQGRQQNVTAVLEERKKHDEGTHQFYKYQAENAEKAEKKRKQDEVEEQVAEGVLDAEVLNAHKKARAPKGKEYLADGMEVSQLRDAKKKRKLNPEEAHAYHVFNQDALFRAQEKRNADIKFDRQLYEEQKTELGEDAFYNEGGQYMVTGFKDSEAGKKRFLDALKKQEDKKGAFSRRRMHVDEADFQHINERNRVFNNKMDRFYGDHTLEIRQNLERGTAL